MSKQVIINGQALMNFQDVSTLGLDPILPQIRTGPKSRATGPVPLLIDDETKMDKTLKINHKCLNQLLTNKSESFLGNCRYLGMIVCEISLGSNINNYRVMVRQLITMHQDIVSKLIRLHKRECNQIALDPNHSSLKYLSLSSKDVTISRQNLKQNISCKVCSRGAELIRDRLCIKYIQNLLLRTINELIQLESLSLISQQWILNKKKLMLESINLANIDNDDSGYEYTYTTCDESYHNYDTLLHDMDIIGQLKSVRCPFHVSKHFSPLKMIINAHNFYGSPKVHNISVSMSVFIKFYSYHINVCV